MAALKNFVKFTRKHLQWIVADFTPGRATLLKMEIAGVFL